MKRRGEVRSGGKSVVEDCVAVSRQKVWAGFGFQYANMEPEDASALNEN